MKQMKTGEAKTNLSRLLDESMYYNQPTLIMRGQRQAGVLVGPDWYERAEAAMKKLEEAGEGE
jgi:PHD/YefM family antitoxin component YafN of YafNO toxin-antitoxin module